MRRSARLQAGAAVGVVLALAVALLGSGPARADDPKTPDAHLAQGFDVSGSYNGFTPESIQAGIDSGADFVYLKALTSNSIGGDDPTSGFGPQWAAAAVRGIPHGAYVLAAPGNKTGRFTDPVAGATAFATAVGWYYGNGGPNALPPTIDLESGATTTCWVMGNDEWARHRADNQAKMTTWIRSYVATLTQLLGRRPIIYTSASWWRACAGNSPALGADADLWVAHWTNARGTLQLPAGWRHWTFWQWHGGTANPSDGGFPGDENVFRGTAAQLRRLLTPPPSAGSARISGQPMTGGTLTFANAGDWSRTRTFPSWTWYADGSAIAGSTNQPSITLTPAQYGHRITLRLRIDADGYAVTTMSSSATRAVAAGRLTTGTVTITGPAPAVGSHLGVDAGHWTVGTRLSYQWYANGTAIPHATNPHFVPQVAQRGQRITVRVTGSGPGYANSSVISALSAPVR